ncbi:MAG TPA: protein kinase [Vicinamibacterales bacterium]|nr:protein kinase [Vicinamibacterales bacterium]
MADTRPERVGPYQIETLLGEGGMGVVYRAVDTKLNRPVAIKFLASGRADSAALKRFQREAQMASSLNHPHILTVHDAGEFEGRQYLVTELVDGGTLRDWARAGRRTSREIVELLVGVADALAAAHAAGMLHRDIKPENILITRTGYAKLADFGLAKLAEPSDTRETRTVTAPATRPGVVVGTVAYMSPEQASAGLPDARSDVFSFGIVLHEMLGGERPFTGPTDLEILQRIIHGKPQPLPNEVPAALRAVVDKALEKSPDDRYQSMKELVVDLRRIARHSEEAPALISRSARWWNRMTLAAGVALAVVIAAAIWAWTVPGGEPAFRSEWVQLTNFPDSVSQPALSPDGRMLTFLRAPGSFITTGQVYVKLLPNGEPQQLTNDSETKMSPVFTPDGSRIAYTTNPWDTWIVPVLGGQARRWLPNASGLTWLDRKTIVFSEVIDRLEGNHMKIVAAEESRAGQRDVYVPSPKGAMAHRSFPSPDGRWIILAEMTDRGAWLPCRVVPADGSSTGRPIGPPGGACWFAAWSPDGRWMYVNSNAGGAFHIWRQRLTESAVPEQITSGPTSEEGIAMAPDGRSLVTAVGLHQKAVWIRDSTGERQISLEGHAFEPTFSPDGKTLYYVVDKAGAFELWSADVTSSRTEPLLPGFPLGAGAISRLYDVSPDGRHVVVQALDAQGKLRLWLAPVNRRTAPQPIPNVEGDGPVFSPTGEIYFRGREGSYGYAYRVQPDGSGLTKVLEYPVIMTAGISPDGKWLIVYARYARPGEEPLGATMAFPLAGGAGVRIFGPSGSNPMKWSRDGRLLFLSVVHGGTVGQTFIVPLAAGTMWPALPPQGYAADSDIAKLPGVRSIDEPDATPGPSADVYAFSRERIQRNLYRIPLP